MIRQLPLIPTVLVVAAAGVMVWLGFWQLGRAEEKTALIEAYANQSDNDTRLEFEEWNGEEQYYYRKGGAFCADVTEVSAVAGTAATGRKGWVHRAQCTTKHGDAFVVDLGFARDPQPVEWMGGYVSGIIAPGGRLVADPPQADLVPLAKPDPNDLPNNHLAYAGQWFFFALTALLIYFIAVRSRLAKRD